MRPIDADIIIRDLTAMKTVYDAIALDGMIKALKEAPTIEIDTAMPSEWVPLTQGKPEEGQTVHISAKMGYVEEGLYTKRYGFNMREGFICDNGKFMDVREVNAWMPKIKLRPYIEEQ